MPMQCNNAIDVGKKFTLLKKLNKAGYLSYIYYQIIIEKKLKSAIVCCTVIILYFRIFAFKKFFISYEFDFLI